MSNLFTAAYEGMAIAAKEIADRQKRGVVACPECDREIPMTDPCFLSTGTCVDCDEKYLEDDAVCACCHSQAAMPDSPFCDLCVEIMAEEGNMPEIISCMILNK